MEFSIKKIIEKCIIPSIYILREIKNKTSLKFYLTPIKCRDSELSGILYQTSITQGLRNFAEDGKERW